MSNDFIAWFSAAYIAAFWIFVVARISIMWRNNISVLTVAPKRPVLNAVGVLAFLGILGGWSTVFVYVAFMPTEFVLLRAWWGISVGPGPALVRVGVVLALAGLCLMWTAILTMGRAWRVGIDDKSPGALVTHGVFGLSRNPIFLGMDTAATAAFLIQPRPFFLLCAACLIVGIHIHIIREERHLEKTYGDAYVRYRERVPRYLLFL